MKLFSLTKMKPTPNSPTNSNDPSPTKTDGSASSIMDPPGYIPPSMQDMLLTDIKTKDLNVIAIAMNLEYLGPASFPGSFPVVGEIWAPNDRLMVNLVCRRETTSNSPARNIIFLIDTGSPFTYLCENAMETLIAKPNANIPQTLKVNIHSEKALITHISPKTSHFADVNVLGMDFLRQNGVFPVPNWDKNSFRLL
jgi:hypothetical protein